MLLKSEGLACRPLYNRHSGSNPQHRYVHRVRDEMFKFAAFLPHKGVILDNVDLGVT